MKNSVLRSCALLGLCFLLLSGPALRLTWADDHAQKIEVSPWSFSKPAKPTPSASVKPTAKTAKSASPLPPLLQEVEKKYTQAATLRASFTQINEVASLKTTKTTSGVIMVKRPDKLRWETQHPDTNLLVSDGQKFWFYTPPFDEGEHGQVIERRTNEINSKLANALLSGRFSVARDMKIRQDGPSHFVLTPKAGTSGTVKQAEIEINLEMKLIFKVVLAHQGGNRSEITLDNIEIGKAIGDELFVFVAPPNTDKVSQ